LLVEDVEASGEIAGPFSAGFVELAAEVIEGFGCEGVEGNAEGEGLMFVEEVEAEDLELAVGAFLERYGGGAVEGHFADEGAGVVGDAAHDVETAGGAADTDGAGWVEVRAKFLAQARDQRGDRLKVE
jgi:hypothetical protein